MTNKSNVDSNHEKVASDFDRQAETYVEQIDEALSISGFESSFFVNVKSDHLVRLARRHFGDAREIDALDIGCGIGVYHPRLVYQFRTLSATDISAHSIAAAKRCNPAVLYETYPGDRLPYGDNAFDLAFVICVMHHVPLTARAKLLSEMRRVIRPGGLGVVFEHNPMNPATQYIVRTCPIDDDAELLWPLQTRRLLRDTGWQIVESRTILSVPPVNSVAASIDRMLGYLPFGAQYYVVAVKR